jgi:hypothetical protein
LISEMSSQGINLNFHLLNGVQIFLRFRLFHKLLQRSSQGKNSDVGQDVLQTNSSRLLDETFKTDEDQKDKLSP